MLMSQGNKFVMTCTCFCSWACLPGISDPLCICAAQVCLAKMCLGVLQLHAAVVELSTAKGAEIKYSTVQNWFAGDEHGVGGIYNFVTKRGLCHGAKSKISWTQVRPNFSVYAH